MALATLALATLALATAALDMALATAVTFVGILFSTFTYLTQNKNYMHLDASSSSTE
jgi:hypothetical protein